MKKIILAVGILASIIFSANAQSFEKGDVMFSPGFGVGLYGVGYGVGFAVPVVFNADIGVHDYVSVGAYAGFWTRKYRYAFSDDYRFTSTHFGARGSFHWWQLLDNKVNANLKSDKLDIYATVWLGYNLRKAKWIGDTNTSATTLDWNNRFQGGAQLGVRYFVSDNFGFFGEWGGTPTSFANAGLTLKF